MPFNITLSAPQLTAIRANGYSARQYVLLAPNTVVFQARVNQGTFTTSFASVNYDTITVGSHTSIKEGYTVYIGATTDIRTASFIGYARRDSAGTVASATSINLNQTSADIADNAYIMVVRDVRLWYKLARYTDTSSYFKDFIIPFRRVRPLVTGMQSAYVKVLSSGIADFAFTPSASAVDADATSTFTWVWDADGGTFEIGTSTSKDVTIRYAIAGHYMPRVTVTDSNGVSNWLTCHVFVVPSTYASVVTTGAEGATIERSIDNGNNATLRFFDGVESVPDYTFCTVWSPNNLSTTYGTDIQFVGRLRNELIDSTIDPIDAYQPVTTFQVEGVAAELGRLFNSAKLTARNTSSPTQWDELKKLTPCRAIGYYLSEHTTLTNISALTLDDLTTTYVMLNYTFDQSSVLEQCNRLLDTTNRVFEYAPSGEIRTARKSWFESASVRNALITIVAYGMRDMQVDASGGVIYSISADMVTTLGKLIASGGAYTEATNYLQVYQSFTPAVSPAQGDTNGALNGQVLTANATGYDEIGDRCANAYAEAQPPTTMTVQLLSAYAGLIPSVSQWYTFTIPAETNNRGVAYTSADRWTLKSLTIANDPQTGYPIVTGNFLLETVGEGYQTVSIIPPNETPYENPVMPIESPYPNLPSLPDLPYPDPDNTPIENMPPFTPEEIADQTQPNEPGTNQEQIQQTGVAGMAWATNKVYAVTNLPTTPIFADATPINLDGLTIRDGKLSKHNNQGYVLAGDGTNSRFFKTIAFGSVDYARTQITGDYRLIRQTNTIGEIYIYQFAGTWTYQIDFSLNNGGWIKDPGPGEAGVYSAGAWRSEPLGGSEILSIQKTFNSFYMTTGRIVYTASANAMAGTRFFATQLLATGTGSFNTTVTTNAVVTLISAKVHNFGSTFGENTITLIEISGNRANSRRSTDSGAVFAFPEEVGTNPSSDAGFDAVVIGSRVFAAQAGRVRQSDGGGAYSDATGGTTTGTYPICMVAYGVTNSRYIVTTPVGVSGESVWKVVSGTPTAITPNDGVSDGLGVTPNCVAMADGIETHIVGIFSFGGIRKIAYSSDGGSTWAFNTQITNTANYIRMIRVGTLFYIAVCDGTTLWWGYWAGTGTLTLYAKVSPLSLGGFEFR